MKEINYNELFDTVVIRNPNVLMVSLWRRLYHI